MLTTLKLIECYVEFATGRLQSNCYFPVCHLKLHPTWIYWLIVRLQEHVLLLLWLSSGLSFQCTSSISNFTWYLQIVSVCQILLLYSLISESQYALNYLFIEFLPWNNSTSSILFGIAYGATPTSPGAHCDLAAFSSNVRSFNIFDVYFILLVLLVAAESPIYSFSCV